MLMARFFLRIWGRMASKNHLDDLYVPCAEDLLISLSQQCSRCRLRMVSRCRFWPSRGSARRDRRRMGSMARMVSGRCFFCIITEGLPSVLSGTHGQKGAPTSVNPANNVLMQLRRSRFTAKAANRQKRLPLSRNFTVRLML